MIGERDRGVGWLALALGMLAVSTSGAFFIMARINAYAAVFWRALIAGALALAIAWLRGCLCWRRILEHAWLMLFAGLLFGTHILLWVKAFELTDYTSNMILIVAQPVFAAMIGTWVGDPPPPRAALLLTASVLGMGLLVGGDVGLGTGALWGDAASIAASCLVVVFYVVARPARDALSLDVFMGLTLLVTAVESLAVAAAARERLWPLPLASWGWMAAIVLVTTLGGHGLLNLAAKYVPLFALNIVVLVEPILGIGLGALLFGASVTRLQLIGGALLGVAVTFAVRSSFQTSTRTRPIEA